MDMSLIDSFERLLDQIVETLAIRRGAVEIRRAKTEVELESVSNSDKGGERGRVLGRELSQLEIFLKVWDETISDIQDQRSDWRSRIRSSPSARKSGGSLSEADLMQIRNELAIEFMREEGYIVASDYEIRADRSKRATLACRLADCAVDRFFGIKPKSSSEKPHRPIMAG